MNKKPVLFLAVVICLYSCSSLKPLGFSSNTSLNQTTQPVQQNTGQEKSSDVKFLNNISVVPQNSSASNNELQPTAIKRGPNATLTTSKEVEFNSPNLNNTESSAAIQMKYAALLNTDVSQVQNKKLFEYIDEWYGTRYCMGGTSKSCIDCSAFVQSLVGAIYGITVPRTAVTQYKASKRISTTELKEGDLLFFHTRRNHGLVTHVGIYLQNNKFVHASSSGGVTISDMYEPYYVQHLIAAGRIIE